MSIEQQDPMIGLRLRDYELVKSLGHGAMGVVYLGKHIQTDQLVAIKFLSGECASKNEFVTRFLNEAAACAMLDHENIVRVIEAGQEDGAYFMIMEYVEGKDLAHILKSQRNAKEVQSIPWMKQAALGLAYAHSYGIIHRDIKPENIMLTRSGVVKIADMGLSKKMDVNDDFSMTMSGTVIGTPYYISPEQARDSKRVDQRTDIYSLGATFYHLVTGEPPFSGSSAAEVMAMHMNQQLIPPHRKNVGLSDDFSDMIVRMMEKDPEKRYQTMQEVVEALDRLERGEIAIQRKVQLKKDTLQDSMVAAANKKNLVRNIGMGMAAIALVGLLSYLYIEHQNRPLPSQSEIKPPVSSQPTSPPARPQPQAQRADSTSPPPTDTGMATPSPASAHPTGPTTVETTSPSLPTPPPSTVSEPVTVDPTEPTTPVPPGPTPATPARPSIPGPSSEPPDEMNFDSSSGKLQEQASKTLFNWVDLIAFIPFLIAIPMARSVGWWWTTIRAFVFSIAVGMIGFWFGDFGAWIQTTLKVSETVAWNTAFLILSGAILGTTYVMTNQLIGHQKENWKIKMNRLFAMIPGCVMAAALALWLFMLLSLLTPTNFPMHQSWVGSKVLHAFPSIQKVYHEANHPLKK